MKWRACRYERRPFGEGRVKEPVCGKGYANEIIKAAGVLEEGKNNVV